ncbi:chromosome alignment-maintaining phosphoprotein 1 [Ambystoma mexicanum]|uniref:chromosome alignment-maintaining phosphoprotein 1 n=1 Tax=Ambystoma mexicanum TaxID=8296 RepID=UPI0037E79879
MEAMHKRNETKLLQCSRCKFRGSDYENLQIHMGTIHPEYCDEMDTAGLGNLVFYQKSAKLFHCFKCFFTSKMFCNVYYHITASHSLPDKLTEELNDVLQAKIEQNGNAKSDMPVVESSDDEKSMDDASEHDEKEQKQITLTPVSVVLTSLPGEMKPKGEESSDADSNSCSFDKREMNLLEAKGTLLNNVEEQLRFESSDNSSTFHFVSKHAVAPQMIPEFSDDEETPPLPKEIMEFSDNEETVPLPNEIMDFSDNDETSTLPKDLMDFSVGVENHTLPKQMMEFSDDEDTPALPKELMEFSDNEEAPDLSKIMEFSDVNNSNELPNTKSNFSDEETQSQSKDAPDFSDVEEAPVHTKDVPEFSDEEETPVASNHIPEFSEDEETPGLSQDIPEFSDDEENPQAKDVPDFSVDENTAQSKERPDFSDDEYATVLSKDMPEFSDNEDTSRSKDVPEFSDNEDTSTRSKDLMDFSDTEETPALPRDLDFSDNDDPLQQKNSMIFPGIKETPVQPKSIMSYSDNEDAPSRPKGIMEFSDDEETTAFSKDIPKFSEGSISPTTPTRPDDVPEYLDNVKDSDPLGELLSSSHSDMTPMQAKETMGHTPSSQFSTPLEMQTSSRFSDIMEFLQDTPTSLNDSFKSPGDVTPVDSKDASESSEEKDTLGQEDIMLKYLRRAKGKYYCLMCECRPMRKGAVLHHLVGKHNIPSPYQCKQCGKNFVLENVYKNHLMSHTEGQYKCTLCSFETNHPRGFKKHQTHCQSRHSDGANKTLFDFQGNAEDSINDGEEHTEEPRLSTHL